MCNWDVRAGDVTDQEAIKPAQTKLSLAFCIFTSTLWNCPCLIWCCLSVIITSIVASNQQQGFRMCVHPCQCYLTGGDTHILCVACLGEKHAREHWLWALRCASPADAPIPPGVLSRGCSGSRSRGLWSCFCRGNQQELWKLWAWPLRGPAHRLRSLNRGCWDHSPLQSSLHEETLWLSGYQISGGEPASTALGGGRSSLCVAVSRKSIVYIYVDCTQSFRSSEQLFVCHGGQQKGKAVSKQRLAHWIVDAVALAYKSQGEPCPLGVRAHSTWSVVSSRALVPL